jgi:RNA polymerase sigma-70 factor (ECF subfamily)
MQWDEVAAIELIDLFYRRIFAFLRRLSGNDADAADLTQRTFSRVWQALPTFAGWSSVGSWIHGIAYHVYVDWRRGNHRTEPRTNQWWIAQPDIRPRPDELADRHDAETLVYAQVDQLEPDLREAVHLHYYHELTLEQTAEAMGIAVSTVKYRLKQALNQLQKSLGAAPAGFSPASVIPSAASLRSNTSSDYES